MSLLSEERMNLDGFIESKTEQAREGNLVTYQSIDEMVDL
jgi:hypothetical protein